jgi:hypothetical protein
MNKGGTRTRSTWRLAGLLLVLVTALAAQAEPPSTIPGRKPDSSEPWSAFLGKVAQLRLGWIQAIVGRHVTGLETFRGQPSRLHVNIPTRHTQSPLHDKVLTGACGGQRKGDIDGMFAWRVG